MEPKEEEKQSPFAQLIRQLLELDTQGALAHLVVVGATAKGQTLSAGLIGDGPALHVVGQLDITHEEVRKLVAERTAKQREIEAAIARHHQQQAQQEAAPKAKKK